MEDEPYLADAVRDGLRLEAIAADIAGDGDTALELQDQLVRLAVLDRDIPGPSGDEIARRIVASGSGIPILMLTAADRIDDKASGFKLGADDYLTKPFELRELVMRLRALDRRRGHARPPVTEIAGLRVDPFRREVFRDGRYVALTRKQFAVLDVLVAAEGGVVSSEELLERAWDQHADPFPTPSASPSPPFANHSANHDSSPRCRASVTESTPAWTPRTLAALMNRRPGLSARLKLTLSYAGVVLLAGALLLAVVWVFLLRYVPDGVVPDRGRAASSRTAPAEVTSGVPSPPARPKRWPSSSCSASWEDGSSPAGCSHRSHGSPTRHGWPRTIAVPPDPHGGLEGRVPRARRRVRHHARTTRIPGPRTATVRRQRLARAAHPPGDLADAPRRRP